jgi:hypothetical protein
MGLPAGFLAFQALARKDRFQLGLGQDHVLRKRVVATFALGVSIRQHDECAVRAFGGGRWAWHGVSGLELILNEVA